MRLKRLRLLTLGLAVLALAPGSAQALYAQHDGVVSANPADTTPNVLDGKVTAILPMGNRIFVGGTFTQVQEVGAGKPVLIHRGLFAFDKVTGAVDNGFLADFDVSPDTALDRAVEALAPGPDGTSLFVGGTFGGVVNGVPQSSKLVKLSALTGATDAAFNVSVHDAVKDIAVNGTRLFVAGGFTTFNAKPRGGLAVVNTTTGQIDANVNVAFTAPRQGTTARVETIALSPDGKTLVAGGNFLTVGGQSRTQIAMIDLGVSPARVADWQTDRYSETCSEPGFDSWMRDIDMAPDGSWFVVVTSGGYGKTALCDAAARWETSARGSGLQPTWWDRSGGDSYTSVAVTGAAVYVGGHIRWLNNNFPLEGTYTDATAGPGSVARNGIAALDPVNGLPLKWNPGRERGEGTWAMVSTPDGLWVGSDTNLIGGEYHAKLSFLPLAGGYTPVADTNAALPGDLWTIGTDGSLTHRNFDGHTVGGTAPAGGGADWAGVRGAFTVAGRLYAGRDDGRLTMQPVSADGPSGSPVNVDLHELTPTMFPVTRMTGMFYDAGRLYHTVSGDSRLFSRWFSPDDNVVGNDVAVVASDGFDFNGVTGMAMASGRLTYAKGGVLHGAAFQGGRPVPGTDVVIAGSAGTDWTSRGMFILPPTANVVPNGNDPSTPATTVPGYWMTGADGSVFNFGGAGSYGSLTGTTLNKPIVTMAATPTGLGYWLVATDGGIFSFGDAKFFGSTGGIPLNKPIVGMAATPSGRGYWMVASDGGIFSFGDAQFFGSTGAVTLNKPIVGMAATPTGQGYWLVATDGGIFAFGDAAFFGSTGAVKLNKPIVGMATAPNGKGYWLTASDGGVFSFGTAPFYGSTGDVKLNKPIVAMAPSPSGKGYWFTASDGGVFAFGDATFLGSAGDKGLKSPVVAFLARR
jgi:hypothetical protein